MLLYADAIGTKYFSKLTDERFITINPERHAYSLILRLTKHHDDIALTRMIGAGLFEFE